VPVAVQPEQEPVWIPEIHFQESTPQRLGTASIRSRWDSLLLLLLLLLLLFIVCKVYTFAGEWALSFFSFFF
jgi:hypothetical protein